MNILTLTNIIMKTKEDILDMLHDCGLDAIILDSIQEGTWVFRTEKAPLQSQIFDTRTKISYKRECLAVWYKNWLTVYHEIPRDCLSKFKDILDNICAEEKINFRLPLMARAQEYLSAKQILIKVNFDRPAQKRILNKICWLLQLQHNIFCQNISNNEFVIDYEAPVDTVEIQTLWDEEKKKRQHAKVCSKLSKLMEIPFTNVMAIGPDEDLLEKYQKTMQRAAGLIAAQEKSEKKLIHYQLFKGDKSSKERVIKSLGIEIGNADVTRLDFSILEEAFK